MPQIREAELRVIRARGLELAQGMVMTELDGSTGTEDDTEIVTLHLDEPSKDQAFLEAGWVAFADDWESSEDRSAFDSLLDKRPGDVEVHQG